MSSKPPSALEVFEALRSISGYIYSNDRGAEYEELLDVVESHKAIFAKEAFDELNIPPDLLDAWANAIDVLDCAEPDSDEDRALRPGDRARYKDHRDIVSSTGGRYRSRLVEGVRGEYVALQGIIADRRVNLLEKVPVFKKGDRVEFLNFSNLHDPIPAPSPLTVVAVRVNKTSGRQTVKINGSPHYYAADRLGYA